ncbi:iron-sulfur cluster assembly scaffold protein [Acidobacteriota bacterium]
MNHKRLSKEEMERRHVEEFKNQLHEEFKKKVRQYSPQVFERWENPRNFKRLKNPDGYAKYMGSCGDIIEIYIRIEKNRISDVSFYTDACAMTIACSSMATELAAGKSVSEAIAATSAEEIGRQLGGLPDEDIHNAQMASDAMRRALADAVHHLKTPWKRHYRKA